MEIKITPQVQQILDCDVICPKCGATGRDIDVNWMNGITGQTGWGCMKCKHNWTDPELLKE